MEGPREQCVEYTGTRLKGEYSMDKENILEVQGIYLSFGGLKALDDVSFCARKGEIIAIIGPNGAGKTCCLNCINGFYHPERGRIYFDGQQINELPAHRIAEIGIARTFQNIELYGGLTTLDNLMAARHTHFRVNVFEQALYFGRGRREETKHRKRVEEIIEFLGIEQIRKEVVGALPYGLRKRVELGRALAMEPKVLLLDEPMAGMNVEEKEDMARFALDVRDLYNLTILLVEHDMGLVMDISDRVVVLDFGLKIAEGQPKEIGSNPKVIQAYLGAD